MGFATQTRFHAPVSDGQEIEVADKAGLHTCCAKTGVGTITILVKPVGMAEFQAFDGNVINLAAPQPVSWVGFFEKVKIVGASAEISLVGN